jgi:hypothetical protein
MFASNRSVEPFTGFVNTSHFVTSLVARFAVDALLDRYTLKYSFPSTNCDVFADTRMPKVDDAIIDESGIDDVLKFRNARLIFLELAEVLLSS